jgi:hypothetical protein
MKRSRGSVILAGAVMAVALSGVGAAAAVGDADDVVTITIKNVRGNPSDCAVSVSMRNGDSNRLYRVDPAPEGGGERGIVWTTNSRGAGKAADTLPGTGFWKGAGTGGSGLIFYVDNNAGGFQVWFPGTVTVRNSCT